MLRNMSPITSEELKLIQLEILIEVDKFCKKNDIYYSLAFGTLLGAIRHKGYIPWDDDIDIMMLRNDYERFLATFKSERYKVIHHKINSKYIHPFAKVYDVDTVIKDCLMPSLEYGVNIDVFPIDRAAENLKTMQRFQTKKNMVNLLFNLKTVRLTKRRTLIKNLVLAVSKISLLPIPVSYITNKMELLGIHFNNMETSKAGIIVPADNRIDEILPESFFSEYIDVSFERHMFKSIRNYNGYLTASFGNYLELPPIEKRVSHHLFTAYRK